MKKVWILPASAQGLLKFPKTVGEVTEPSVFWLMRRLCMTFWYLFCHAFVICMFGLFLIHFLQDTEPSVITWQDYEGRTALHLAVAQGNETIAQQLINFQVT